MALAENDQRAGHARYSRVKSPHSFAGQVRNASTNRRPIVQSSEVQVCQLN